jgi:3-phenylpropionate/trans-cinnamate dioxygenase ferredoxin reductase subunit
VGNEIVIVGGGLAAASFVGAYREAGGRDDVTILSADDRPPYNRPPLSKGFLRGDVEDEEETFVHPASFYADHGVDLRLGVTATRLDTDSRSITLDGGSRLPYGRLVLATGAHPRRLPVPGAELGGVHAYRTLADATAVRQAARQAQSALVIGGSFIGSEVAASLRLLGLDVTVVELGERLVPALASDDLSRQLEALYRDRGVELRLGDSVAELRGEAGAVTGARLASGEDLAAALVVVGVGVAPNVGLVEGTPVEVDDGVVVDDAFRTSVEGVYAIGDVARFPDRPAGRTRRIEHWTSANAQGAHLGRLLAGSRAPYDELAVFFTQLFDLKLQVLGDPDGGVDDVALTGSVADRKLLGLYVRAGRVVGAVLAGQDDGTVEQVKAVVRERPEVVVAEELLARAPQASGS